MFSVVDMLVFGSFLLMSILVGIYHGSYFYSSLSYHLGVMSKIRTQKHTKTAEYLTGGRKLPIFPVVLSLLTTFISGISLLGMPSEIYLRGFAVGISYIMNGFAFAIIGIFFIPIFYKLQFLNAYEYFEMRFDSVLLRKICTCIFLLNTLIYLAVVVYAPAVALAGVTNVPLWPFILGVGIVGTFYTSAGGIKGVIWTDTLQAGFLYVGLAMLLIKSTQSVGGIWKIFELNEQTGRLSKAMFKFDPTLLQWSWWGFALGSNLWTQSNGPTTLLLNAFLAGSQNCSMVNCSSCNCFKCSLLSYVIFVGLMTSYIGLLLVAFFNGCDPMALGEVETPDQMTILMAVRVLNGINLVKNIRILIDIPGFSGLFLSTLFSATLSTVSSGLNSMAALLWEDFLKDHAHALEDRLHEHSIKLITILFGILSTILAFACHNVGGIFQIVVTIMGATTGPLVGLFFLGAFFPMANKHGAFTGLFASSMIMITCAIMNNLDKPYVRYVLAEYTNDTSQGCINYPYDQQSIYDERQRTYFISKDSDLHFGEPNASFIARISPYCYSNAGIILVVLIAIPVSLLFPQKLSPEKHKLAQACTYRGLDIPVDKITYQNRKRLLNPLNTSSKQLIRNQNSIT